MSRTLGLFRMIIAANISTVSLTFVSDIHQLLDFVIRYVISAVDQIDMNPFAVASLLDQCIPHEVKDIHHMTSEDSKLTP